jgi:hypothetical protein
VNGFRFDQSSFDRVKNELASISTRELPVFLNSRMLSIAKDAQSKTPKVERSTIENDLSVVGYALNYTKAGDRLKKNSKGRALFGSQRIFALVNARQKKLGLKPISKYMMAAAAQKFLNKRLGASGTLRAGWSGAVGKLAAAIKEAVFGGSGPRVKMSSTAIPAKDGWSPRVSIEYRENVEPIPGIRMVDPRVVIALESAFAREESEMKRHLEQKVNEIARKAGAK